VDSILFSTTTAVAQFLRFSKSIPITHLNCMNFNLPKFIILNVSERKMYRILGPVYANEKENWGILITIFSGL